MINIDANNIYLTRGNTASITVELIDDNEPYIMTTGDKLTLSVKRRFPFNDRVLEKTSTTGNFEFGVIDTIDLAFGEYDFDITFYGANGNVDTVITGVFEIGKEAHTNVNS